MKLFSTKPSFIPPTHGSPTDDPRSHEIQAVDMKTIAPNGRSRLNKLFNMHCLTAYDSHHHKPGESGAKAITILSKTGDVLLEVEASSEELRDQWMTGLNEVLLHNFRVVGEDGVVLGQPRNLKERAEKEIYFREKQKELEQKKKQTDERKQKLMKELGGGLKYTALSMANRASATDDGEAGAGGGGGGS